MSQSLPLGLLVLGGGAVAVWAGITDPEGGLFAGLRNIMAGAPNTKHVSTTAAAFVSTLLPTGGGSSAGAGAAGTGPGTAPLTPAATGVRASIVAAARGWLGVPYAWGGESRSGVDCSGMTQDVYAANRIVIPRTAALQQARAHATGHPQTGDLVFFGAPAHHVGVLIDSGQTMIHAPHTGTVVRVESVASVRRSLPGSPVTYGTYLGGAA